MRRVAGDTANLRKPPNEPSGNAGRGVSRLAGLRAPQHQGRQAGAWRLGDGARYRRLQPAHRHNRPLRTVDRCEYLGKTRWFGAKFARGREYIFTELFTWLSEDIEIEQIAICPSHPKGRDTLGGGRLISIDEFIHEVRTAVAAKGPLRQRRDQRCCGQSS